ncbi:MAG: hypothetical protein HFI93_01560 [Lachnospiraceae bacterium]|nr:hypothetical protein [Lachnospiraceae bacterium]
MMKRIPSLGRRMAFIAAGSTISTAGCVMAVKAGIGLAPWDAFFMGVSLRTGLLYGDVMMIGGFLILAMDVGLKEKVGLGSFLCTWLSGPVTNLFMKIELPVFLNGFAGSVCVLLTGVLFQCLGTYTQMQGAFGCGPRDAFLVGLGRKFSRYPLGLVRGFLEGTVLLIGWLLGAEIGIGTLLSVAAGSVFLELVFGFFHFDAAQVEHEGILDTAHRFLAL